MVKTCISVIVWKIHGSVPFQLVCILFFASIDHRFLDGCPMILTKILYENILS